MTFKKKEEVKGFKRSHVASSSMYKEHFERWANTINDVNVYGKAVLSGNNAYIDNFYGSLRQLYIELFPLIKEGSSDCLVLNTLIEDSFKGIILENKKLMVLPKWFFDKKVNGLRNNYLGNIVNHLRIIDESIFQLIQLIGLGIHTNSLLTKSEQEAQIHYS